MLKIINLSFWASRRIHKFSRLLQKLDSSRRSEWRYL